MMHLVIVNRNENHPVLAQQLPCRQQPGVHHIQPVGMVAAVAVTVGVDLDPFFGNSRLLPVGLALFGLDKIVTGIIRRVDVDAFDLSPVGRQ